MDIKTPAVIQESIVKNGKNKRIFGQALKALQIILGCLLFIWLILYFSNNNLIDVFKRINVYSFALSIACWIFVGVLMSERLAYLSEHNLGVHIPLIKMFLINQLGMLLSDFTPGRSGYFGIMYYLKIDWKIAYDKSFGVLVGVQLIDFLFKAIFSTIAVMLMLQSTDIGLDLKSGLIIGLLVFIGIVFACFILIWYNKVVYLEGIFYRLPLGHKLAGYIKKMNSGVSDIKSSWVHISLLSLAGTAVISLQWWLIGYSLNIHIPIVYYLVIPSLISAIAFIPIGIAGLGVQELSITAILIALGSPAGLALTFSILLRLCNILGDLTGIIKVFGNRVTNVNG